MKYIGFSIFIIATFLIIAHTMLRPVCASDSKYMCFPSLPALTPLESPEISEQATISATVSMIDVTATPSATVTPTNTPTVTSTPFVSNTPVSATPAPSVVIPQQAPATGRGGQ